MNLVEFAAVAFREVLAASLFGSILAVVIVALQIALRRRLDAAWRHALWMIVLLRLTVPALPESPLSLFNVPRWVMADKGEKPRVTVTLGDLPPSDARTIQLESESSDLPVPANIPTPPKPISLFETIALVWLTISTLFLVRLLVGSCWLHFQLMKNARIANPSLVHILTKARSEVRTLWNPRPVESAVIHSPGLFGCLRPKLLLPVGIGSHLSEAELRHVFLHELAHLKRGDLWVNLLLSVVQALHWFNPCVWLVTRRMRLERELACDALVLRATATTETRAYGETILKLLERLALRPTLPSVVGILEEKQSAAARLTQIAQFPSKRPPSRVLCFLVLASLILIGLSNAQTQKRDSGEPLQTNVAVDRNMAGPDIERIASAGIEALENEYHKQTARVEKLQRELDGLRSELNLAESPDRSTFVAAEELSRIQQDLSSAKARYVHYKSLVDALNGKTRKELRKLIPTVSPDVAMDRYLADLAKAEQQYASNINNLGPEHPEIANIVQVMKTVNQQIEDRIDGVLAGLDLQVTQSKALLDELQGMAKERQASANDKRLTSYFAAKRNLENELRTRDMIFMRILAEKVDAQIATTSTAVAPLIHDARLLIELGHYDEAEAKLSQALKQDPENEAALRVKALLNEKRATPKPSANRPEGQIDLRKSRSKNVVSDVSEQIEASTLIENARLFLELGKTNEAEKRLKLALQIDPGNKLAAERLAQLNSTSTDSSKAEESAPQAPKQPLRTRTYRINPNTMLDAVFERPVFWNPALKGRTVPVPLEPDALQASIREFFAKAGFKTDAVPPGGTPSQNRNAIFFNDRTGVLMVRGTLADLDIVENTVQKMSLVPAQVTIETKVIEIKAGAAYEEELLLRTIATNRTEGVVTVTEIMSDPQFKAVVNALENRNASSAGASDDNSSSSGILTESEYRRILGALEKQKGVSVLAAPKVTTLSNRAARISVEPGPTVDINPLVEPDRQSIHLTAEATIPAKEPILPEIKAKASHRLRDGQTIAIWPKQNPGNNVVIFVTATIIDSAGNRVNDPAIIPDTILPQQ